MQTFLPFEDFTDSARALDLRRLGKQRVETYQVMAVLTGVRFSKDGVVEQYEPGGWRNHPAVVMWREHTDWLMQYQYDVVRVWRSNVTGAGKPFSDTCLAKTEDLFFYAHTHGLIPEITLKPTWLGDLDFHRSHQANLMRKAPEFYDRWFPNVDSDLPYIWPTCMCASHDMKVTA